MWSEQIQKNWSFLIIAVIFLFNVVRGLVAGQALMFHKIVKKSEDPVGFWAAVAMSGFFFVASLWFVFSKI